jgi:SHS2 domain-containing protein
MNDAQPPYRFEVRDHAADKAATAYGRSLEEVFAAAAYAMFDLMFDLGTVRPVTRRRIEVEAPSSEELLRQWLAELLFLFDTEKLVFSEFAAGVEGPAAPAGAPWRLSATARGQRYSERIGRRGAVVKAVTYHRFALCPPAAPGGDWRAEMVFDV